MTRGLLALVLSMALPLQAQAKKPHPQKAVAAPPVVADAVAAAGELGPAGVVDDFHELLRQGRRAQVLALLTEDAVIFENGYAGQSREDYGRNNVGDDADFAGVTDYLVLRRQVLQNGATAWVLTRAVVQGIFDDQTVDLDQTETTILRHLAEGWRISHIHWSAHSRPLPATAEPAAPEIVPPPSAEPVPASSVPVVPAPAPAPPPPVEEPPATPPPAHADSLPQPQ